MNMRKPDSYRPWCITLLAVLVVAQASRAADLHFLIFAETLDPDIGTVADLDNATDWSHTIAQHTGLSLQAHNVTGYDLTTANARNVLHALSPDSDDVVYFFYTGHGANSGNSQWPTFTFVTSTGAPDLTFDEVVSILQPKAQRLLIVMADCCNAPIDSGGRFTPPFEPSGQSALTTSNFQRLFLQFRGTIMASASAAGQYSLGDTATGGLFVNTYMEEFLELAAGTPDLTWQTVLSQASTATRDLAAYYISTEDLGDMEPQHPQ
jgi:hypothetical protein